MELVNPFSTKSGVERTFTPRNTPTRQGNSWFYPIGFSLDDDFWYTTDRQKLLKNFLEIPELNHVINWKASAVANGRYYLANKKTGEEVTGQKANEWLRKPNYFQTWAEFIKQSQLFRDIFGNEFIYKLQPFGFRDNIKGLFTLPPQYVNVDVGKKPPFYFAQSTFDQAPAVTVEIDNRVKTLEWDDLALLNDNNTGVDNSNFMLGRSKMASISAPIDNLRAAYEGRNTLFRHRAALGILSNADTDGTGAMVQMDEDEKKALQNELASYGMTRSQRHIILTNLPLSWNEMPIDVDKLKIFKEIEEDFTKMCDAYGIPVGLFKPDQTYENKAAAERSAIQNTVMPAAMERCDAINDMLLKGKPHEIRVDFSHLPVMQENMKERATTIRLMVMAMNEALDRGAITLEQYKNELEKLGIK